MSRGPICKILGVNLIKLSSPSRSNRTLSRGRPSLHRRWGRSTCLLGSRWGCHLLVISSRGHSNFHCLYGRPVRLLDDHLFLISSRGAPASTAIGSTLPTSCAAMRAAIFSSQPASTATGGAPPAPWAVTGAAIFLLSHPGGAPAFTAIGGAPSASWAATGAANFS